MLTNKQSIPASGNPWAIIYLVQLGFLHMGIGRVYSKLLKSICKAFTRLQVSLGKKERLKPGTGCLREVEDHEARRRRLDAEEEVMPPRVGAPVSCHRSMASPTREGPEASPGAFLKV